MARQVDLLSLSAKLDLNTASFNKGMASANKRLDRMDKNMRKTSGAIGTMGNALKGMAAGMAAAFTVGAMKDFIASAVEAADRVDKLSQVAGLTAESFQRFEHVASLAGVSADTFAKATATLSRRIGNARAEMGPLHSALSKINPELLEALKNTTSNEQALLLMADAMNDASNQADRGALSMAAFGGSADKMTIALKGGSEEVKTLGKNINVLTGVNARAAADFSDRWNTAFNNFQVSAYNATLNVMRNIDRMFTAVNQQNIDQLKDTRAVLANKYLLDKSRSSFDPFGTKAAGLEELKNQIDEVDRSIIKFSKQEVITQGLIKPVQAAQEELGALADTSWTVVEAQDAMLEATTAVSGQMEKISGAGGGGSSSSGGGGRSPVAQSFDEVAESVENVTSVIVEQESELKRWADLTDRAINSFASGFADTLVDAILTGEASFKEFAASFLAEISKMIAQALILAALQKAFGGIPGIGSLFGFAGGFAEGGKIPAGSYGLVGERGAELVRGPATVTSASETAQALQPQAQNIRIINVQEESAQDYLGSDAGERKIMNILQRNKSAVQSLALA